MHEINNLPFILKKNWFAIISFSNVLKMSKDEVFGVYNILHKYIKASLPLPVFYGVSHLRIKYFSQVQNGLSLSAPYHIEFKNFVQH